MSICPLYGGLVLAKAPSLCCERDLDIEQNGQNQNHQDFSVRLSDILARCVLQGTGNLHETHHEFFEKSHDLIKLFVRRQPEF